MTETIQTAMDRLMTISAEPQDYIAGDGLLYCGSCNTPNELAGAGPPDEEPGYSHDRTA